jgi:hypothetical protein
MEDHEKEKEDRNKETGRLKYLIEIKQKIYGDKEYERYFEGLELD